MKIKLKSQQKIEEKEKISAYNYMIRRAKEVGMDSIDIQLTISVDSERLEISEVGFSDVIDDENIN